MNLVVREEHIMRHGGNQLLCAAFCASWACGKILADEAVWTLREVTEGPTGRYGHAMAYDTARGVTVLFGGYGQGGELRETWEWDGNAWTVRAISGPSARYQHAM